MKTGVIAIYKARAEIHLGRLKANYRNLSKAVGNAAIMAIVKADGYGHGMASVARALVDEGVTAFGVATFDEALDLRAVIPKPMILHCGRFDPADLPQYVDQKIRPSVESLDDIDYLQQFHDKVGYEIAVHLKIDTGLGRLGVPYDDGVIAMERLAEMPYVTLEGLYSHFATSGEAELSYLRYQQVRFNQFVHLSRKMKMPIQYYHLANSAAMMMDMESRFNMVRAGILLYGVNPSPAVELNFELEPVMDLMAPLVLVKDVPKGTPVGYGRIFRAPEPTKVGTILLGYADGLPVNLANCGLVEINGDLKSIIGRLSMDLTTLDLGGQDYEIGTQVHIWGKGVDPRIRVEHLATLAGTIPYALIVSVGNRVERIYKDD